MRRGQQIANRIGAVTARSVVSNTAPSEAEKDAATDRLYTALESDEGYGLTCKLTNARTEGDEKARQVAYTEILAYLDARVGYPWVVKLIPF